MFSMVRLTFVRLSGSRIWRSSRMRRSLVGPMCAMVIAASAASLAQAQDCVADLNGDGRIDGVDLVTVISNWGTCPATVASVTPSHGSVLGGTVITIAGTGLAAAGLVTVGGVPCTDLTLLGPGILRATTPPGAVGLTTIAVTTPSGTSVAPMPFNYVVQSVDSIVPASGPFAGGTTVTISGQHLAGTTMVTIGGVPATNVVVVNSTTVTASTPAGSVATVDVVLTGPKGTVTLPDGFTYQSVSVPPWATLLEAAPDPAVVPDESMRNAIIATGLPWRVRDSGTQIEMVLVPPGTFQMGCSASNAFLCASDGRESPVHAVSLTNACYMGRYEVTQAQWQAVMGSNPSHFQADSPEVPAAEVARRPVEQVSWDLVQFFLWATALRLPTEAEWERAARAGTTTAFHGFIGNLDGTNDDSLAGAIAWVAWNSGGQTRPVGGKAANGLGLHDMSGNVWEWVSDRYSSSYYAVSPHVNPTGPDADVSTYRTLRGGSWAYSTIGARCSTRYGNAPEAAVYGVGFRVARNPN